MPCGYEDDVAGINEEIIGFVKEISLRPECWVDFPLPLQNDFTMTGAQREHASNIERFVPSLARLRNNLRSETGDGRFWMVYFILLIPRLNERDFEILLTPQIVETRNVLLEKLENKKNVKLENSNNSISETQGENTTSREEVAWIVNAIESLRMNGEENSKQFLKDQIDSSTSMDSRKRLVGEEVSFSDLEDDDSDFSTRLSASRKSQSIRAPSPSGSSDWVQLNESSDIPGGLHKARQSFSRDKDSDAESTEWHKVDEFD
ncbi:BSD DOMAIN-CONTAINING PROTEIN [Salix purpurea]|uniref:BSD DOMAIN-CONTAINING PROTEIN n=1 Tax=Salix purpurea TaxID=77065 RepID=A0A9Q0T3N4_SALPP|nr:BSD DOMAIN-CONTAINING PROTEIN [Salix purpurea]